MRRRVGIIWAAGLAVALALALEYAPGRPANDNARAAEGPARARPKAPRLAETSAPEIAGGDPKEPALHGPRVVGTTPGRPFLFKVPFTGQGKVTISATGLPPGLKIDAAGRITGSAKAAGEYQVRISARSNLGQVSRRLTIVAGRHKLALTPPMGWNSWNVWGTAVTAERVKRAADAMVRSGLAAKGYLYVNIDDTWEGKARAANGRIMTNEKFGDMKALADYVHARGLKLGIYSSPGPKTCAGYLASYRHEDQDAKSWARWGIDYLKYDLCSYGSLPGFNGGRVEDVKKPYVRMRQALDRTDRDIVYSLCEYGMADVWKWGASPEVGGNCWRTTGDITDTWQSLAGIGFSQGRLARYAGPGHWNDPDMLVVGAVGWGNPHPTHLTPQEQVTHITLWSMLAAPLLIGCDMSKMDRFTTDLLTNADVIDVDQDPLGRQAVRVAGAGDTEVWARPLWDGTVAVALFNRGNRSARVRVQWSDLNSVVGKAAKVAGAQAVRDLWKQKDLGRFRDSFQADVAVHGAVLLKVGTPRPE